LTFSDNFGYNNRMARPIKDKSERKDYDLRVPLTEAQKDMIIQAARIEGEDRATWARSILLDAAKRTVGRAKKTKHGRK
jgi:uncharacterized protein (DUF1778 family)